LFKDREDAARKLSDELKDYCSIDCVILGIPRGGAIVAYHVARILNKPWDIIVPRKIGVPFNKEVAIGAVTQDGNILLNEAIVKYYNIPDEYIKKESMEQTEEIKRRIQLYKGNVNLPDIDGKTVILVDDGIATGFTAAAAINSIKHHNPQKIIIAVPVASVEAITYLASLCDKIICIETPDNFIGVSSNYLNFRQNTDQEVIDLFAREYSMGRLV
jgi:Predicted phosphoribosyltransferases